MKTKLGDVCADCGAKEPGGRHLYVKIGVAFSDEQGRISLKIDTVPIPSLGWTGWCNVFEDKFSRAAPGSEPPESDIPF